MNIPKLIGNFLIVFSISLLGYIYWPLLIQEYTYRFASGLFDPYPISENFSISIPKLSINEKVIANVNPFDPKDYQSVLKNSVAHAQNTSTPDHQGTVFLFAHSSDNPFSITRYNTAFYLLPKLEPNDIITITYQSQEFQYQVIDKKIVDPKAVEYLQTQSTNQLILQTCYPPGTSFKRLLVFATPIEP